MKYTAITALAQDLWGERCRGSAPLRRPRTSPGSHVYRELPNERCSHGILPVSNCPQCCPGSHPSSVTNAAASATMTRWWQQRRRAFVPPADGRYRCCSCAKKGRECMHEASAFYTSKSSVRGLSSYCRECSREKDHSWRSRRAADLERAGRAAGMVREDEKEREQLDCRDWEQILGK